MEFGSRGDNISQSFGLRPSPYFDQAARAGGALGVYRLWPGGTRAEAEQQERRSNRDLRADLHHAPGRNLKIIGHIVGGAAERDK